MEIGAGLIGPPEEEFHHEPICSAEVIGPNHVWTPLIVLANYTTNLAPNPSWDARLPLIEL